MNRYYFISLDRERQLRLLKLHGKILHRKLKREYTVSLYQMENFYIEIWENNIQHKVMNTVIFKDRTLLKYQFNLAKSA